MNARVLAVASLLPLAAVLVVSTAFAGSGEHVSMAQLRGVNFVSSCTFSHRAADDPIVFFGKPGVSHDHSFVGNTGTNASSTLDTLLAGGTTCQRPGDTAAYWMPTLYVDGQPVTPNHAQIYYRRSTRRHVEAFPPGFRMIAGDAKATSPQRLRLTFWNCGVAGGVAPSSTVPTCPDARAHALRLHVTFPSCWDGKNLDSASHAGHVAYPVAGRCPAKFAHALPADLAHLPLPRDRRGDRDARLGRPALRARRLLQRLAAERPAVARRRLPQRAASLPARELDD